MSSALGAADIVVSGLSTRSVYQIAETCGFSGLERLPYAGANSRPGGSPFQQCEGFVGGGPTVRRSVNGDSNEMFDDSSCDCWARTALSHDDRRCEPVHGALYNGSGLGKSGCREHRGLSGVRQSEGDDAR
jgi:hypothetical protein